MRQESSHRKQWLTLAVRGGMNRSGNDLRMRVPNKTSGTKPQQFGFRRFQKHWASRRKARGGMVARHTIEWQFGSLEKPRVNILEPELDVNSTYAAIRAQTCAPDMPGGRWLDGSASIVWSARDRRAGT